MAEVDALDYVDNDPYSGAVYCSVCGESVPCVATSYGYRACCGGCRIRWTFITGESGWVGEVYSSIADDRDG